MQAHFEVRQTGVGWRVYLCIEGRDKSIQLWKQKNGLNPSAAGFKFLEELKGALSGWETREVPLSVPQVEAPVPVWVCKKCGREFRPTHRHGQKFCSRECMRESCHKCKHPSEKQLREMVEAMPVTKIAEKYGVSDPAVHKWMRKAGVQAKPRGFWTKGNCSRGINLPLRQTKKKIEEKHRSKLMTDLDKKFDRVKYLIE